MRARKPWVWCDCGAPRRSAANASSGSSSTAGLVALEHGDRVPGPAERQRGGQPADAAADDHDPLADAAPPRPRSPPDAHVLATLVARTLRLW